MTEPYRSKALNLVPIAPARLDVDPELRAGVSRLHTGALSIQRAIGGIWTTEASMDEAERLLIQVATDALNARLLLMADRKRREDLVAS